MESSPKNNDKADLEARLSAAERALEAVTAERDLYRAVLQDMPDIVGILLGPDHVIHFANPLWLQAAGNRDAVGLPFRKALPELDAQGFSELLDKVFTTGEPFVGREIPTDLDRGDGELERRYYTFYYIPIRPSGDAIVGIQVHAIDITTQVLAEQQRKVFQERLESAQKEALRELSTPLIPLAEGLVVMPLIGLLDSTRAQLVMETLLSGIVAHQARIAVLDVTGVRAMDGVVAESLVRAARAARLLGAEVILSGIEPNAARALVEVGADLTGVMTLGTLQAAVAYALSRRDGGKAARGRGTAGGGDT